MATIFSTKPTPKHPRGVACRLVRLNGGMRYWVFDRLTGADVGSPSGYATEAEARKAAK